MDPVNVLEYEALAEARLDAGTWGYYSSGTEDEVTLRANRTAFARLRLRPRVLVDVSQRDLRASMLGTQVSMPIVVAPTALQCLAHPEGECATARAAGAAGTLMTLSTAATRSLEEVAAAASGPLWFQLYVYRERQLTERMVRRAEDAGYRALVLTVDAPRWGRKERELRAGFTLPPHLRMANFGEDGEPNDVAVLTWESLAWLRALTSLPIVVKGILTAEDARLAVEHGAAGVIVSNHGGRQLDSVPATIEALPEVARAVAGHCEVYLDGGIRRGTDVLKALALGARAVFIGRPALWGLAVDGEAGVRRVLELLREEFDLAMALAGRPTLASIDASLVMSA